MTLNDRTMILEQRISRVRTLYPPRAVAYSGGDGASAPLAGAAQRLQRWGVQITASEASRKFLLLYPQKGVQISFCAIQQGGTKSLQKLPVG